MRRARQHWFVMVWRARWSIVALVAAVALLILRLAISGQGTILDILGYVTLILLVIGLVMLGWGWLQYQNEEFVITSRRIIHVSGVINKRATDSSLEMINDAVLTESMFGRMFGFGDLDVLTASETGIEKLRMLRDAKSFKKAMIEAKHDLAIEIERPTMPPIRATDGGGAGASAASESSRPAASGWGRPAPEPETAPAPTPAPPPPPAPAPAPTTMPGSPAQAAPGAPASPPQAALTGDEVADALDRLGELRDRGVVTPEEFEAKKRELLERL